ncbi:MAG: hypothetical protein H7A35_15230 [Planctomycetales bacterium]|nr:hypothetical protein [bacterium]UNM08183.1 MAG: hypothetical protein H7A35_15230 [Planctomycetales bacterium]
MSQPMHDWWASLRHGGMLVDMNRLVLLLPQALEPEKLLQFHREDKLRRELAEFHSDPEKLRNQLVRFILEHICGIGTDDGKWLAGTNIDSSWNRHGLAGESIKPQLLWQHAASDAVFPVFIDSSGRRLGIGRSRREYTRVLRWLRSGRQQLAILTNGFQWRIIFAGLDYDAWCEWESSAWFSEGQPSAELAGFCALVSTQLWLPAGEGQPSPLVDAVNDSRKGQAELSAVLGERVRKAAEKLIIAHAPLLSDQFPHIKPEEIYRASVRMIMRIVVLLFAESREGLLPRDNEIYHNSYSVQQLRDALRNRSDYRLKHSTSAWPRLLALMYMVYKGSPHEAVPIPQYGGELFQPGSRDSADGLQKVLHIFENGCYQSDVLITDLQIREILNLLTMTEISIRQGRSRMRVPAPVDFSSLDSEYIGILYEGLLDFELRQVGKDQPIVFLAVGNQPALPLETLEAMDDKDIRNLLEKMKDKSSSSDSEDEDADEDSANEGEQDEAEEDAEDELGVEAAAEDEESDDDQRATLRQRAEEWARKAVIAASLVKKTKSKKQDAQAQYERDVANKAKALITAVLLPGQWYLVRWGGTRKGSGTFYTRPQLAIPTAHRTLRPLAYDPPTGSDGQPDTRAAAALWTPKLPEQILALKVCDPACGSGSFPLAAMRFLTNALFESLIFHKRIDEHADHSVLQLIEGSTEQADAGSERIPVPMTDDNFEQRTKAVLKRYIVERCIYGVDLDPLAVELCRLSLWIETLDRSLPMTFLNHKIKCGNSLVGAWFDQFAHYPVMAWEREAGDTSHTNGVNYAPKVMTKQINEIKKQVKAQIIGIIDDRLQLSGVDLQQAQQSHADAMRVLNEIHGIGINDAQKRTEKYEELLEEPDYIRLKESFDLWCAIWFWPLSRICDAPLPTPFAKGEIDDETIKQVRDLAAFFRFFHWELEFPDVFNADSSGFDAMLGNPPWDIAKPNSKEWFSAQDPLYRTYGKQEALAKQRAMFSTPRGMGVEGDWLAYCDYFKAMSNWVKYSGFPFGNRESENSSGSRSHDFSLGTGGKHSFANSVERHELWRKKSLESRGFADTEHVFRHQGSGDINLYKTFLEQAHALLRPNGRMGFIVPSGVYSDFGTIDLRRLFIEHCQWEWLFGFENREGIFDIHRSFKFNPLVIQKGGETQAVRTAFMRRDISDWENGEDFETAYPREQVQQFSPNSLAILEIQSDRDLEILTKIYSNSVLLGDQGPDGWGIKYATEFHMTNDSRLFPPRPKWEEWGYIPDEYSRWVKGPWRSVVELWQQLGVDPARPVPLDAACQQAIEAGIASGEVERTGEINHRGTEGTEDSENSNQARRLRIAQPPYDRLPIPRADIPEGIILSRDGQHFIHEDDIPVVTFTEANGKVLTISEGKGKSKKTREVRGKAIALPLYQGAMIWLMDYSFNGYASGAGNRTSWENVPWSSKQINAQFMLPSVLMDGESSIHRWSLRDISNATNQRSFISALLPDYPAGNSVPLLKPSRGERSEVLLAGTAATFVFDFAVRLRMTGMHLNYFILEELPLLVPDCSEYFVILTAKLNLDNRLFAGSWLKNNTGNEVSSVNALSRHERVRLFAIMEALMMGFWDLSATDACRVVAGCDVPLRDMAGLAAKLDGTGFWRVDKDKHPEHRLTVLSLVAFHDLMQHVEACGGDREAGIASFMAQNDGEGWMLPESLRLADYALGHDERAKEHQPVRECFGPRFYDWQLAQTPEESWKECHLHVRNLLGKQGYQDLLDELAGKKVEKKSDKPAGNGGTLFGEDN